MSENALVQIIVALIAAGFPTFTSIYNTKKVKRQANRHACRQSILQLIIEDKVAVHEGKHPENYQAILSEYDEYLKNGGNSYIHNKVEEYTIWYTKINKERNKNGKSQRNKAK